MATLLSAHDDAVTIDFANLQVAEVNGSGTRLAHPDAADPGRLALTAPGLVVLHSGVSYHLPAVRLERWDGPPPDPRSSWEEADELPFVALGSGRLKLDGGFGSETAPVFTLGGPGRYRSRVCVHGRQLAARADGAGADEVVQGVERWLLQLWPDPHALGPLAGPPRTLLPDPPEAADPQLAAGLRAWHDSGWFPALSSCWAFSSLWAMFLRHGPVATGDVPRLFPTAWSADDDPPPVRWERPLEWLDGRSEPALLQVGRHRLAEAQEIVDAAGGPPLRYPADLVDFLVTAGVLSLRQVDGIEVLAPNPAAPSIFELGLPEERALSIRRQVWLHRSRYDGPDLQTAVTWSGGRLRATLRALANRLAVTPDDVRGGALVQHFVYKSLAFSPDVRDVGDDEPVDLWLPHRPDR